MHHVRSLAHLTHLGKHKLIILVAWKTVIHENSLPLAILAEANLVRSLSGVSAGKHNVLQQFGLLSYDS